MIPGPDRWRLEHMRRYRQKALDLLGQGDAEALEADEARLLAIIACVQIVGEAANRVTLETQARFPGVPWRPAIDTRNVIVHQYFEIKAELIVDSVRRDLPLLIKALDRILAEGGDIP